jgi:glycosyltransferase involved in cell wall biosynthesis
MTHVLAIHLNDTLAIPPKENQARTIQRHMMYARDLDYYCIITKTLADQSRSVQSPLDNMDVLPTNSSNRYGFLKDAYQMACQVIEQKEIDVLTVPDWRWLGLLGLLLRRKYHAALNVQLHSQAYDNPYYQQESFESWVGYKVGRFVIPKANTWWVGTQTQRRRLIKKGLPKDFVFYAPFFIPTDCFQTVEADDLDSVLDLPRTSPILLWVGRMIKAKGLDTLLRSFNHVLQAHPGVTLVLVGDGPERARGQELAEQLDVSERVRFCGYVSYADVPGYYAAADVVCVSSLYEGTCRIIIEGMAAGKPVVSTDVDGALDAIVDGVTGYVVPRRSPGAFAEAVLRVLEDEDKAHLMGQAARERLKQHFPMEQHFSTFIKMWETTSEITHRLRADK